MITSKKKLSIGHGEFLTEVIKLDKNRLYVTVYPDDQEAYDTWHKECGVEESHISRLEDNFWEIG